MKTETKTIKCWASVSTSPDMQKHPSQFNVLNCAGDAETHTESQNNGKWKKPWITVPCTITLELPVEEKKVTISESELAEAWYKMSHHTCYALSKESVAFDIFKQKIFGGG